MGHSLDDVWFFFLHFKLICPICMCRRWLDKACRCHALVDQAEQRRLDQSQSIINDYPLPFPFAAPAPVRLALHTLQPSTSSICIFNSLAFVTFALTLLLNVAESRSPRSPSLLSCSGGGVGGFEGRLVDEVGSWRR